MQPPDDTDDGTSPHAKSEEKFELQDFVRLTVNNNSNNAAPDGLVRRTPRTSDNDASGATKYLIVFVTGNPSCVEFYRNFLEQLRDNLTTLHSKREVSFEIYGRSFPGFEIGKQQPSSYKALGLEDTIAAVEADLSNVVRTMKEDASRNGIDNFQEPGVILIGHSVGAYIALHLIQRHRARLEKRRTDGGLATSQRPSSEAEIVACIGLFPTVVDIAMSEKGQSFTRLSKLPFFPAIGAGIVRFLTLVLPRSVLEKLVIGDGNTSSRSAAIAMAFVKSPHGMYSALHLARDEMALIGSDCWSDEIWGAATPSAAGTDRVKLWFLFAENDHWVAEATRDEIVKTKGRLSDAVGADQWKPIMEIDRTGIPHGFGISHSTPVARKCADYVQEFINLVDDK